MDTDRVLLSCPGRIQDWLGAAAEQIEALLQAPLPSLSGSDEAIGALRIKRENLFLETGPYNLRPATSATSAASNQISLSVSSDGPLCTEVSPSRCENCVAEEGSRCSRDLPSCTRCRKNGFVCFYMEGVPTGRRKPQKRRPKRSPIGQGGPGLLVEPLLAAPASESPALLGTDEVLAARYHHSERLSLYASEHSQPSLQHPTISSADSPTYVGYVEKSTGPHRINKLEAALDITWAESPDAVVNGLKSSLVALVAAEEIGSQDSTWVEGRKTLNNSLGKCVDDEVQHNAFLPLQVQSPRHISVVSSLATTPLTSTLGSRSTSQSSETDSLPITPATELSTLLDGTNTQLLADPHIPPSQASSVSHTPASFPSHKNPAAEDKEAPLSQMGELMDLCPFSHHRHQTVSDAMPNTNHQDNSFTDEFIEKLFEEGDAARRLVGSQRRSP